MRITARLTKLYPLSRRAAKEAVAAGLVTLDGRVVKKDENIEGGALEYKGRINKPDFRPEEYLLFKNGETLFLYKPPFMHSDRLRPSDGVTVSDIMERFPGYKSLSRLDYETDGVIGAISEGTKIETLEKRYLAIVSGRFPDSLTADWSVDAADRRKVAVVEDGGGNRTVMKRLSEKNGVSLIEATLEKASRHQVRAFCAHAGHPIIGDKIYGRGEPGRLLLHCERVTVNGITINSGDFGRKFIDKID